MEPFLWPHDAVQCSNDVRSWVVATEVAEHRQGQLVIWAFGGVARRLFDTIDAEQFGVDLGDGNGGYVHVSAVEFIIRVLETQLLVQEEARMFRPGWDVFKFMFRRGERPEYWPNRFDNALDEANRVAEVAFSVTFQSWMLLCLLQFTPKCWFKLLKDLKHRLPNTMAERAHLQQAIVLEKGLEGSTFHLRQGVRNILGASGGHMYFPDEGAEPRPLFMCLGDLGGISSVGRTPL